MWLEDASSYEQAFYMANDWDGDKIFDFALTNNPVIPTSNKITWNFGLPIVSSSGSTVHKEFDASIDYTDTWSPGNDRLEAVTPGIGTVDDIDEDEQMDTYVINSCRIDKQTNGTLDKACCRFFVFDNTPSITPPDITADFLVTLTSEEGDIESAFSFAYLFGTLQMIDQNMDGKGNDFVLMSDRVTFALSFIGPIVITVDDIIAVLLGRKEIPPGQEDYYDKNGDGKINIADIVWMIKT
jgi:hypothetical protein